MKTCLFMLLESKQINVDLVLIPVPRQGIISPVLVVLPILQVDLWTEKPYQRNHFFILSKSPRDSSSSSALLPLLLLLLLRSSSFSFFVSYHCGVVEDLSFLTVVKCHCCANKYVWKNNGRPWVGLKAIPSETLVYQRWTLGESPLVGLEAVPSALSVGRLKTLGWTQGKLTELDSGLPVTLPLSLGAIVLRVRANSLLTPIVAIFQWMLLGMWNDGRAPIAGKCIVQWKCQPRTDDDQGFDRFLKRKPSEFEGGFNPESAYAWIQELERIFGGLQCIEAQKVDYAVYIAECWWKITKARLTDAGTQLIWENFKASFLEKYFPDTVRSQKELEFMELKQGSMTVEEYAAKFEALCLFYPPF
ncbi:hypothetical protein RJT34_24116 [Clitoria ternatea]|uniref:Retrotransposon gag domain-containing protein n=1 Tax=Clitoria ternatea TaxID=43366 RepID=A0AAN9FMC1_CLITE